MKKNLNMHQKGADKYTTFQFNTIYLQKGMKNFLLLISC